MIDVNIIAKYLPQLHLSYTSMLPLHVGTLLLQAPSRQVILTVPVNLKLAWQVNETFFPCRKSKPILRPFCGLPGSVHDSENFNPGLKVQGYYLMIESACFFHLVFLSNKSIY